MKKSLLHLLALATLSISTHAAITVSGSSVAGTTATFAITEPITFTMTAGMNRLDTLILVFDEWVSTVDGRENNVVFTTPLSYFRNGTQITPSISSFADNYVGNTFDFTSADGSITFPNIPTALTRGDVIVIPTQTRDFTIPNDFNPALFPTNFTGNAFLVNLGGFRVSSITAVPEPSCIILLGSSLSVLLLRRHRSRQHHTDEH